MDNGLNYQCGTRDRKYIRSMSLRFNIISILIFVKKHNVDNNKFLHEDMISSLPTKQVHLAKKGQFREAPNEVWSCYKHKTHSSKQEE